MNAARALAAAWALLANAPEAPPPEPPPFPASLTEFARECCGIEYSPAMAAIADASEGREVTTLEPDQCRALFGCDADALPREMRRVVVVRAGGRGGKTSRLLALKALHAALTVPLPTLRTGEHAWSLCVAPDMTLAIQGLNYIRGYLEDSPQLRKLVQNGATDEDIGAATCITIKRPHDGALVDLRIGVASGGGKWARGKTLVFCGFDEAAFFLTDEEKVTNDKHLFQAAMQRIVPGAQLWMVSTPWIEGEGVMEAELTRDFGKHEDTLCACAPTRVLNPTWDPDYTIERHLRKTDPENAAREIDAIPLPLGSKVFFPLESIKKSVCADRPHDLKPEKHFDAYAAADLGFARNSSALGIAQRRDGKAKIVFCVELKPKRGEPLMPSAVCRAFVERCAEYGAWSCLADKHYAMTGVEEFAKVKGLDYHGKERGVAYLDQTMTQDEVGAAFFRVRDLMAEGQIEIPDDANLIAQLRRVTSKPTPGGGVKIVLPTVGTSHLDLALACVLALARVPTYDVRARDDRPKGRAREMTRDARARPMGRIGGGGY